MQKIPARFELTMEVSKTSVLTITLRNHTPTMDGT